MSWPIMSSTPSHSERKLTQKIRKVCTPTKAAAIYPEVSTKGSKGQVHQLTWKHEKGEKPKSSTMFPDWMPPDHVKTLIALKFSDDTSKVVKEKIDFKKLAISSESIKTYISHGQDINIEKKGDTVYPTK